MIRPNIEAELEVRKKELEEVKRNIATVRLIQEMAEDKLIKLNCDYSDLIYTIGELEEQIEEAKENYED